MKTPILFSFLFLLGWSGMGMGFPDLVSGSEECPQLVIRPQQVIQAERLVSTEKCVSRKPARQAVEGGRTKDSGPKNVLPLLGYLPVIPLLSGVSWLSGQALPNRIQRQLLGLLNRIASWDGFPNRKGTGLLSGYVPPFLLLMPSLGLTMLVPAQPPTPKPVLEAAVYSGQENPFWVYVRLDNPRRRMVSVSLFNQRNQKLFADWTRKWKYNVKLNLSELPNGAYRVEITDGRKMISQVVNISTLYEQKTQRILSLASPVGE